MGTESYKSLLLAGPNYLVVPVLLLLGPNQRFRLTFSESEVAKSFTEKNQMQVSNAPHFKKEFIKAVEASLDFLCHFMKL